MEHIINLPINMRVLRRRMFLEDRLPLVKNEITFRQVQLTTALKLDLVLIPQGPVPEVSGYRRRPAHRSMHRLLAICTCGRRIPVGRLAQHKH